MQNKKTLILIPALAVALAVSGCGKKEAPRGAVNNNNAQQVNSNVNENQGAGAVENGNSGEQIDMRDWLTYRNEEYGFEVKYPKEWNIFNKSNFSKHVQEGGITEVGFTYDEVIEGVRPMDNMVSLVFVVGEYQKNYFENQKEKCLKQKTCDDKCEQETCYNLQEILIDNRDAIKFNYVGVGYGNPIGQAVEIKLNKNKILSISGVEPKMKDIISTLKFID